MKIDEEIKLIVRARETLAQQTDLIRRLTNIIKDLRNELCLKCGKYKEAHNGACDGCRWKRG